MDKDVQTLDDGKLRAAFGGAQDQPATLPPDRGAEVAARLRENVREIDLVGRLGGDEFAIAAEDLDFTYKIRLEDAALDARRGPQRSTARK